MLMAFRVTGQRSAARKRYLWLRPSCAAASSGVPLTRSLFLILQVGASEWSAPLFFTVYGIGVGLTIGFAHMESVILLKSDDAIQGFLDKVNGTL